MGYLATVLRMNHINVEIFHPDIFDLDLNRTINILNDKRASIIGFSVIQRSINNTKILVKQVRKRFPDVHITLGGFYPTLAAEEILSSTPEVDSIVFGEGEYTLLKLTQCVMDNKDWRSIPGITYRGDDAVVSTPPESLVCDLDKIPFPARDTLGQVLKKGGNPYVISSRGCYSSCSFCSVRAFYNLLPGAKWRTRSASNLIAEIEDLIYRFDIGFIGIQDDNVFGAGRKQERILQIADEIRRNKLNIRFSIVCRAGSVDKKLFRYLKEVGLTMVFLGIESMNQDILDIYNKHTTVEENKRALSILDELRIFSYPHLIMFNPYTDIENLKTDLSFITERVIKGYGPFFNMASSAVTLKIDTGTPLYHTLKEKNWVTKTGHRCEYKINNTQVETLRQLFQYAIRIVDPLYAELGKTGSKSLGIWNHLNITHLKFLEALLSVVEKRSCAKGDLLPISQTYVKSLEKIHHVLRRRLPSNNQSLANLTPGLFSSGELGNISKNSCEPSPLDHFVLKTPEEISSELEHFCILKTG